MLYKFFQSIQSKVVAAVTELEVVEWFNNQYESTILRAPACWVEFPDAFEPDDASKELIRAEVTVRLHVVSKVLTKVDGMVPDSAVIEHEAIANEVLNALKHQRLIKTVVVTPATEDNPAVTQEVYTTKPLRWRRWKHEHKYLGWMVTQIDFSFTTSDFEA